LKHSARSGFSEEYSPHENWKNTRPGQEFAWHRKRISGNITKLD
jgi:hypothetical protein